MTHDSEFFSSISEEAWLVVQNATPVLDLSDYAGLRTTGSSRTLWNIDKDDLFISVSERDILKRDNDDVQHRVRNLEAAVSKLIHLNPQGQVRSQEIWRS